ncbi:hypothetical protein GTN66_05090 [bacterium]|nr:hypothetical protein [bacterium]NIN92717.1 hypothetical protein [bacterium]NIO18698.1 hypothetical protein [bacterium]NIO73774.1 hypothetical protein [bacterium]
MMDFKKLCQLLTDYFDEELESDICAEIDELVSEDFGCKVLFNTFNRTLQLCKEMEEEEIEVPEEVHIRLYEFLEIELRKEEEI